MTLQLQLYSYNCGQNSLSMLKTWKALAKRIKITKHKLLKRKAGQNHFNTKERGKTVAGKRRLVSAPKAVRKMLN